MFSRLKESEVERAEEDLVMEWVELEESAVVGDELFEPILLIRLVARTALIANFHRLLGILQSPKVNIPSLIICFTWYV